MTSTALLASDLDGTLIPLEDEPWNEEDVERLAGRVRACRGLRLAYVTGRHLSLALEGIRQRGLPDPEFLVCDVGTSVHVRRGGRFELDEGYRTLMRRASTHETLHRAGAALEALDSLTPQGEDRQSEFKRSYSLPEGTDLETLRGAAEGILRRGGFDLRLVLSVHAPSGRGLLDVVPARGGKEGALRYLQRRLDAPPERVAFAGDSGNDIAALVCGFLGILVGNAAEKVRERVRREAEARGTPGRVYFAARPHAGGVLEGCEHFALL